MDGHRIGTTFTHRTSDVGRALSEAREIAAFGVTRLADSLEALARAVERHATEAEGDQGLIEDIVTRAPRLGSATASLTRDHAELPEEFRTLSRRTRDLVADAEAAFDRLADHQGLASDLLQEAYFTDIGGGS